MSELDFSLVHVTTSRWPELHARTSPATIVFQMGQARWADTGTAQENTALTRPGPLAIVPVPGTARCRARAWAAMSARGLAQARHDFWAGTMWPDNSPPLDEHQ